MWQRWKRPDFPLGKLSISTLKAAGMALVFSYVFYRSCWGMLVLPLTLYRCIRQDRQAWEQQQRQRLARQFTDMILAVSASLQAGYSIENAFLEAEKEIGSLYGADSEMARELARIRQGLNNRIPLEQQLLKFGQDCGVEEILDFTEVFAVLKHSGGNLREMIRRTADLTRQRLEVEEEICRMLAARRFEMKILNLIPLCMYGYIQITSPGFFDVLYHNSTGICFMSAAMAGYLAAVWIAGRIMDIRV